MTPNAIDVLAVFPAQLGDSLLRETLSAAFAFAETQECTVECIYLSADEVPAAQSKTLGRLCHKVFLINADSEVSEILHSEAVCELTARHLEKRQTVGRDVVVFCPPNDEGEELCARLSARLKGHAIGRCQKIDVEEDAIACERPGWGGRLVQCLTIRRGFGQVFLCQRVSGEIAGKTEPAEIDCINFETSGADLGVTLTDREYLETTETLPPIDSAKFLVAGGRSVGVEGFDQLRKLAECLDGSLAGSLPAVDNGMVPAHRQVGISGKFVRPDVYLAVGISGTPQHLAGVSEETTVIAINSDPEASIFNVATAGVVGEWQTLLPELLSAFEK